jgi:hypothetical protein
MPVAGNRLARMYQVPTPQQRAGFVPQAQVQFLSNEDIHERLRRQDSDLRSVLMLEGPPHAAAPRESVSAAGSAAYWRPSPDVIEVDVTGGDAGYVCVLESWDPGWSATMDGNAVQVLAADDVFLCAPVPAGQHQMRFTFRTPGAQAGMVISVASALGLLAWTTIAARMMKRSRQAGATP